jgi:hypothetical protein
VSPRQQARQPLSRTLTLMDGKLIAPAAHRLLGEAARLLSATEFPSREGHQADELFQEIHRWLRANNPKPAKRRRGT